MSHTSRSRTPSRASTPALSRSSPSRLVIPPALHPSSSLSNLHIHIYNSNSSTSEVEPGRIRAQDSVLDSSASSVANMDMTEGILIQEPDAEVDTVDSEDATITIRPDISQANDSKKLLRDHLRKTLHQTRSENAVSRLHHERKSDDIQEINFQSAPIHPPREYFVLTDAGKPVFVSRVEEQDQDHMTSTIGIMQALISVFLDDSDKLRCINAGKTRITFLLRPPLYYVCASSWCEPESVTRSHLEFLHLQILSIVTAAQLRRIFEKRNNFDLRRLLNGAESFLTSLLERLQSDIAMGTSALNCLKLDPKLRKRIADTLIPSSKLKDILYVMLVTSNRVVTLIRPKKHSIHPADIHIVLNTIHSPSIYNSPASASWIPICLPKFNPAGFVNAYISFLRENVGPSNSSNSASSTLTEAANHPANPTSLKSANAQIQNELADAGVALVCIGGSSEFELIRDWCNTMTKKLSDDGALDALLTAIRSGQTEYSVSDLGIPGLRHFIYKSRAQVQVTLPVFEEPYDDVQERTRILTIYQALHDAIHAKSGQDGPLKLQYIRTDSESVMGWITQPFELYISLSPFMPKSAAVGAANAVVRWVKREEGRLFLRDAPVF